MGRKKKQQVDEKVKVLPGQEKIFEAIREKNTFKLWDEVKLVGYKEIESANLRRMVMLDSFKRFDPDKNNNFITYYLNNLHYRNLNSYKRTIFTNDKRAIKDNIEWSMWPCEENLEPVNQNSNILRNFKITTG